MATRTPDLRPHVVGSNGIPLFVDVTAPHPALPLSSAPVVPHISAFHRLPPPEYAFISPSKDNYRFSCSSSTSPSDNCFSGRSLWLPCNSTRELILRPSVPVPSSGYQTDLLNPVLDLSVKSKEPLVVHPALHRRLSDSAQYHTSAPMDARNLATNHTGASGQLSSSSTRTTNKHRFYRGLSIPKGRGDITEIPFDQELSSAVLNSDQSWMPFGPRCEPQSFPPPPALIRASECCLSSDIVAHPLSVKTEPVDQEHAFIQVSEDCHRKMTGRHKRLEANKTTGHCPDDPHRPPDLIPVDSSLPSPQQQPVTPTQASPGDSCSLASSGHFGSDLVSEGEPGASVVDSSCQTGKQKGTFKKDLIRRYLDACEQSQDGRGRQMAVEALLSMDSPSTGLEGRTFLQGILQEQQSYHHHHHHHHHLSESL